MKLAEVERLGPLKPAQPFDLLALGCLVACYFAAHFKADADPGAQYRRAVTKERANLRSLAGAVGKLRGLLAENPKAAMWGFPDEYTCRLRKGPAEQSIPANVLGFLDAYEQNLRQPMPELHGGPFVHRFTFACLHYKQAKMGRRGATPDVAGALLFNLVFFFRKWTHHGTAFHSRGEPLPTDREGRLAGRPCYNVAATLASMALGADVDERTARTRVESLHRSGASLWDWPNE